MVRWFQFWSGYVIRITFSKKAVTFWLIGHWIIRSQVKEYKDPLFLELLVKELLFLCETQKHFQCNLGHTKITKLITEQVAWAPQTPGQGTPLIIVTRLISRTFWVNRKFWLTLYMDFQHSLECSYRMQLLYFQSILHSFRMMKDYRDGQHGQWHLSPITLED